MESLVTLTNDQLQIETPQSINEVVRPVYYSNTNGRESYAGVVSFTNPISGIQSVEQPHVSEDSVHLLSAVE
jgi:hypothetical protein